MPPPVARRDAEPRDVAQEEDLLVTQSNLAGTYSELGRDEEAVLLRRDVFSGCARLHGKEHKETIHEANNYAMSLIRLKRCKEAKSLLRKSMPMARRVLGEGNLITLWFMLTYAASLYKDNGATLDDLRESVTTLEDAERTARRVLGGTHPLMSAIEGGLLESRAALRDHS